MSNIAVVTTFPNHCFEVYAKKAVQSFVQYWPEDVTLLVQLDDDLLAEQVGKLIRPQDALAIGWTQEHADFVARNKDKDDNSDYRKQVTRFSHKVFAIHRAYQAIKKQKEQGGDAPRYLIWLDADVITTAPISLDGCLPKEGDAVSFLGRKDWPHSECGWLAFDLEKEGGLFIDVWHGLYTSDMILSLREWHDSWAFDHIRLSKEAPTCTNLTEGKPGMDIWPHSPMGKWSTHYKGPVAKNNLSGGKMVERPLQPASGSNFVIKTKNSVPDEKIKAHITENQTLINKWVRQCKPSKEEIVVVSAGPQLCAEDVMEDYHAGKKIVAVKHALQPLKNAGIRPWACILLDPRPHVLDFVLEPDTDVIWFVASQVDPKVTTRLLAKGCRVVGYHASVGAGEQELTEKQSEAVIGGGSATATRGLFLLAHLGFTNMKLYGYDLCFPDKPDLNAIDEIGQPKYMELSIGWSDPLSNAKKCFWTKPELVAQFEEINSIIQNKTFQLDAYGDGIVPYVLKAKKTGELRRKALRAKMGLKKPVSCNKLLKSGGFKWNNSRKIIFLTKQALKWPKILLKTMLKNS